MTQLSKKFADNVLDSTNAFDLVVTDEARLAGLPERDRAAARESAKKKGLEGWRFTLQAPSLAPRSCTWTTAACANSSTAPRP